MTFNADWEREAPNWAAWARTPGHDAYWRWSGPPFFEHIVPPPGRATLDVGCGEGRVARDLAARGHSVTGIDASPTLVELARAAHPDGEYVLADAAALPFADASFDLVVAFNSLMDVQDMPGAIREAARVLDPGGRLCVSITHPLRDSGHFEDDGLFVIDAYFGRRRFEGTFARDGLEITFRGWCYPLEDYTEALAAAGFLIEELREPPDVEPVPNFLQLRALVR